MLNDIYSIKSACCPISIFISPLWHRYQFYVMLLLLLLLSIDMAHLNHTKHRTRTHAKSVALGCSSSIDGNKPTFGCTIFYIAAAACGSSLTIDSVGSFVLADRFVFHSTAIVLSILSLSLHLCSIQNKHCLSSFLSLIWFLHKSSILFSTALVPLSRHTNGGMYIEVIQRFISSVRMPSQKVYGPRINIDPNLRNICI